MTVGEAAVKVGKAVAPAIVEAVLRVFASPVKTPDPFGDCAVCPACSCHCPDCPDCVCGVCAPCPPIPIVSAWRQSIVGLAQEDSWNLEGTLLVLVFVFFLLAIHCLPRRAALTAGLQPRARRRVLGNDGVWNDAY